MSNLIVRSDEPTRNVEQAVRERYAAVEYLNVCQTQISASGLEKLRERFPNSEIEYDVPVAQQ